MKDLSQKILIERKKLKLNQKEFAKLIGKSIATISRWERGEIENIDRLTFERLAEILGKPTSYFFDTKDTMNIGDNNIGIVANNIKSSKISNNINEDKKQKNFSVNIDDIEKRLEKILEMRGKKLISEKEYNQKRQELIDKI